MHTNGDKRGAWAQVAIGEALVQTELGILPASQRGAEIDIHTHCTTKWRPPGSVASRVRSYYYYSQRRLVGSQ